MKLLDKIFGTYSDREIKIIMPMVEDILSLDEKMQSLSDSELQNKTKEFRERLANGETLEDILVEAFAVVREASTRTLGMKHFEVQLIGGIILHQGRISEMKTGEGKTLVATLPVYLNALSGKGVHVVTVNDYLAKRDAEWMGKIYKFLGLTVGVVVHGITNDQRRDAYLCDITYGTNNEYGFDYLRDNMVIYKEQMVQRDLNFAIVDEVDSILIDEARTPLIISGIAEKSTDLYKRADDFVKRLKAKVIVESDDKVIDEGEGEDHDYVVDLKAHGATLVERGIKKAEQHFGIENLADAENLTLSHHINQALKARGLMKNDIDYVVKDGQVIIVDEHTGRLMFGRRYNEGLHQAIEAKENVKVENESKTLATITFQNYFRMYSKLSGMTGTATTEEEEFRSIYKLDVVVIPTNRPITRIDQNDVVYKNEKAKFRAVVEDIIESNKKGQPVLVGTISIEKSEILSDILKRQGVKHEVLNAKYHEKEAEIISQAGKFGVVTIATNMAGRGTDIMLGGNPEYLAKQELRKRETPDHIISQATAINDNDDSEVIEARKLYKEFYDKFKAITDEEKEKVIAVGGLKIIGTERHESRRIDNQLRGRSGRQGDPGESRFYISLQDDLMKLFGSERILKMADTMGLEEDMPIEMRILTGAIETAQKRVEGRNFGIRKHVLQYDDVMNLQREKIYSQRKQVLNGENIKDNVIKMIKKVIDHTVEVHIGETQHPEEYDIEGLSEKVKVLFDIHNFSISKEQLEDLNKQVLKDMIEEKALALYEERENELGPEALREAERVIVLRVVDEKWMDHIDNMEELKYGVGIRAYSQRDPIQDYKFESNEMFIDMNESIINDVANYMFHIRAEHLPEREQVAENLVENINEINRDSKVQQTNVDKVGRNELCPCGSGKKYKKCCGVNK